MLSFYAGVAWTLSWLLGLWEWLTTPSIIPWVGMVAAMGAALTIRPRDWLACPKTFVVRPIQVAAVWLVLVFLLGMLPPGTPGHDKGTGKGTNGDRDQSNKEEEMGTNQAPPVSVKAVPASTGGAGFDLTVRFVPSEANTSLAQEFACDLIIAADEDTANQVEIRADDMENFEVLLVKQLRDFKATHENPSFQVRVQNTPSPGQSVLRKVVDKIRVVLDGCEVSVGGPE